MIELSDPEEAWHKAQRTGALEALQTSAQAGRILSFTCLFFFLFEGLGLWGAGGWLKEGGACA